MPRAGRMSEARLSEAGWRPDAVAAPRSAERLLRSAAERAARHPARRAALVLHLSRLRPPAPRPHHQRVAGAILQDAAQRSEGQVFALGNGDQVLICTLTPDAAALPDALGRLLHVDAPNPADLLSFWDLEADAGRLLDYAAGRFADRSPPRGGMTAPDAVSPLLVTAAVRAIGPADWPELTTRQVAVTLDRACGTASTLRPLFREVALSLAALQPRLDDAAALAEDALLLRQFALRSDGALLAALTAALGGGGPLDAARRPGPRMHLDLALGSIAAPAFAAFAAACRSRGAGFGVEVALADAVADPAAFAEARRITARAGCTLALDGVAPLAMLVARPWTLPADLLKLEWSPQLAGSGQEPLADALAASGPGRIVLCRVDGEAAMRWGVAHGISGFQGRYVDALLAASRQMGCPAAAGCTLRQCADRAAAAAPAGRQFCRHPDLLDADAPRPLPQ